MKCSLFNVAALKSGSSCSSAGLQKVTNTGMSDLAEQQQPNEKALPSPGPFKHHANVPCHLVKTEMATYIFFICQTYLLCY